MKLLFREPAQTRQLRVKPEQRRLATRRKFKTHKKPLRQTHSSKITRLNRLAKQFVQNENSESGCWTDARIFRTGTRFRAPEAEGAARLSLGFQPQAPRVYPGFTLGLPREDIPI